MFTMFEDGTVDAVGDVPILERGHPVQEQHGNYPKNTLDFLKFSINLALKCYVYKAGQDHINKKYWSSIFVPAINIQCLLTVWRLEIWF